MKNSYTPAYRRSNRRSSHHNAFDAVDTAGDALLAGFSLSNCRLDPYRPLSRTENASIGQKRVIGQQEFGDHNNDREKNTGSEDKVIRTWPLPQSDLPMAIESLRQTPNGTRRAIDIYLPQFHADNADESNGIAAALDNVAQLAPRRRPKMREPEPNEMVSSPAKTLRRLVLGNGQGEVEERMRRINKNFNRAVFKVRTSQISTERTRSDRR